MINGEHKNLEWRSRWIFFFAAMAGAIGLGNIWKFPFVMADNGGIAFIVVYLISVILLGVPLMLSEVVIGHIGNANPAFSFKLTAIRSKVSKYWSIVGYLSLLAGFGVFILLTVVSGWSINYLVEMYQGSFIDIGRSNATEFFSNVKSNTQSLLIFQTIFVAIVVFILGFGINRGLARGLSFFIPLSVIILFTLIYYSLNSDYFYPSLEFLFSYDKDELTLHSVILAIEHAFYSLSIGVGSLMIFGAYLPKKKGIGVIVLSIACVDVIVSTLIGIVIVPLLLFSQIEPAIGYDLLFITLPVVYGDMIIGQYLGVMFFIFVILTALSSAMVLLEPSVAWVTEFFKLSRWSAVVLTGFAVWLCSLLAIDGFAFKTDELGFQLFDWLNLATAKVLLPLIGLLVTIYAGWFLRPTLVRDEVLNMGMGWLYVWYFLIRLVVPSIFVFVLVIDALNI